MNRILDVNIVDRSITVEAGVVTEAIQREPRRRACAIRRFRLGRFKPDRKHRNNAGSKVIRYGMTRNWVRGLKVVTGAGEILDLNKGH